MKVTQETIDKLEAFIATLPTEAKNKCSLCNQALVHLVGKAMAETGAPQSTVCNALADSINETAAPLDKVNGKKLADKVDYHTKGKKAVPGISENKTATPNTEYTNTDVVRTIEIWTDHAEQKRDKGKSSAKDEEESPFREWKLLEQADNATKRFIFALNKVSKSGLLDRNAFTYHTLAAPALKRSGEFAIAYADYLETGDRQSIKDWMAKYRVEQERCYIKEQPPLSLEMMWAYIKEELRNENKSLLETVSNDIENINNAVDTTFTEVKLRTA